MYTYTYIHILIYTCDTYNYMYIYVQLHVYTCDTYNYIHIRTIRSDMYKFIHIRTHTYIYIHFAHLWGAIQRLDPIIHTHTSSKTVPTNGVLTRKVM